MKKKKIIITVSLLVVAAGIFFLWPSQPKQQMKRETARVTKTDLSRIVTATGTVEPITNVEVGTQVSGIISHIYADFNSVVKKGQILAELDKVALESELASQKSLVKSADAEYVYQEKNYKRSKELFDKGMISASEYEEDYYNYTRSKNSLEKARSDMQRASTNLGYATIYSPIDGVVLSRAVDEGQTVAASFNTPTLFTIANDLTKMQVIANVDEADIGQVEEGQTVTFDVDAYPDDVFQGKVTQVRLEATTTSNVVTYEVVINAPNPDLKLKPGLTANVSIRTLERNQVLTVPSKALKYQADKNNPEKALWVLRNGQAVRVPVQVGYDDRVNAEIESGVSENEEVIVEDQAAVSTNAMPADTGERSPFMQGPPGRK